MKKIITILLLIMSHLPSWGQLFGGSLPCQSDNNVNCDWPDYLEKVKRSVFIVKGNDLTCTGVLINQDVSQENHRQLFMTANHCVADATDGDWKFVFNFQSSDCNNNSVPDDSDINGSNRTGKRYTFKSPVKVIMSDGFTDMALCEIIDQIPPQFNVFYAGWTTDWLQDLTVAQRLIHHPASDIKKVAVAPYIYTYNNYSCHIVTEAVDEVVDFLSFGYWKPRTRKLCSFLELPYYVVPYWISGTSEPGSSGSPMFNFNGRVIGIHSGSITPNVCALKFFSFAGRLNSIYNLSSTTRNTLNPGGGTDFNVLVGGRQIDKYDELLNLNGDYFPAKDYQSENLIQLNAVGDITTSKSKELVIRTGAEFVFNSDSRIILRPGFRAEVGASFRAQTNKPGTSSTARMHESIPSNTPSVNEYQQKITVADLPKSMKFDPSKYLKDFVGALDEENYIQISPNPSNGIFDIHLTYGKHKSQVKISITSSTGLEVLNISKENLSRETIMVDISAESSGLYYLKIQSDKNLFVEKIILLH